MKKENAMEGVLGRTTFYRILEIFIRFLYRLYNSGNLLDLVLRGELDEAKRLIENGADVRAEDQHGKKKKMKKKFTKLSLQMIMN